MSKQYKCTKCLRTDRRVSQRDGLCTRCKSKAWYWTNKGTPRHRAAARKSSAKRSKTAIGRFTLAKGAAKAKGAEWNMTFNEYKIIAEQPCFYCNSMPPSDYTGAWMDRIDFKGSYSLQNVLPCCSDCNWLRQDRFTVNETKVMVSSLITYRSLLPVK